MDGEGGTGIGTTSLDASSVILRKRVTLVANVYDSNVSGGDTLTDRLQEAQRLLQAKARVFEESDAFFQDAQYAGVPLPTVRGMPDCVPQNRFHKPDQDAEQVYASTLG